jgi:S1-C subfamily serine protease
MRRLLVIAGVGLLVTMAIACSRGPGKTATRIAEAPATTVVPATTTTVPATTTTTRAVPKPTTTVRAPARVAPPVRRAVPVSSLTVQPVAVQPVIAQPLTATPAAIAAPVLPGVVDIDSDLVGGQESALGTGMVLSSSGVVLTNNHVVDDSTSITATEVATGQTYQAAVIGVDPTDDVAAIQLVGASGVPTVVTGDSSTVAAGQAVVGIGNAEGAGGTPTVTSGTVETTDQTISASDSVSGTPEHLTGMIETDALSEPGDSGGPLVDQSSAVIGMVTAGGVANGPTAKINVSFAIPINEALSIVAEIEAGDAGSTVLLGLPGYLGVVIGTGASPAPGAPSGAVVTTVEVGSPAATTGLVAGDTIVSVDGSVITSSATLVAAIGQYRQGTEVTVGWIDVAGVSRSAAVTLAGGPAD